MATYDASPRGRLATLMLLVLLLSAGDSPHPAAKLANAKWEGPWMGGPILKFKTTIYYGPWQCRQAWMNDCEKKCGEQNLRLMGCIWLADVKFNGDGYVPFMGTQVQTGTHFAVTHCCCDYAKSSTTTQARQEWERERKAFRKAWSDRFGDWPKDAKGQHWPGHHVHDLARGGDPKDPGNLIPAPPDIHSIFNNEYLICYSGKGQWATAGPYWPYRD